MIIKKEAENDWFKSIKGCPPPDKVAGLKGFTLAEVLITLGIIGVVAAMTMPSLIQKHKEKEYAAKLIKFNSLMSQALITAVSNEGDVTDWGLTYYTTSDGLSDEELEQIIREVS